ncbi:MAG TPA: hypothetical protein VKO84_10200 [Gaiellaceae bacterium]|nr:hypothetical protein [Gaiellaceae bacterium]
MSRKTNRMQDLRAAKDKRMKKIAIGGVVLLVLVLAYEVPKVMKLGKTSSPAPAVTTTTTTPATTGPALPTATPTATATPASLPAASNTQLTTSDLPPVRSKSQLYSFTHFSGKDPFVQQVQGPALGQAAGATNGTSGGSASAAPAITAAKMPKSATVRTLAAAGAVKIEVNGRIETVRAGGSFPSADPLFKLVAIGAGGVKIGIANGSYASGARAVSLTPGRTLTLVDTADGIRYQIRLIAAA